MVPCAAVRYGHDRLSEPFFARKFGDRLLGRCTRCVAVVQLVHDEVTVDSARDIQLGQFFVRGFFEFRDTRLYFTLVVRDSVFKLLVESVKNFRSVESLENVSLLSY